MRKKGRPHIWLGIDAGYSDKRRSTGMCAIGAKGKLLLCENVFHRETSNRIAWLRDRFEVVAAGIDGPIVGQRLHAAATRAARQLGRVPVFEAFPNAYLGSMLPPKHLGAKRGRKSDVYWERCLEQGVLQRLAQRAFGAATGALFSVLPAIKDHDHRAAVVCALTARFGNQGIAVVGSDGLGSIMLPPWSFIQPWLRGHLNEHGLGP